MPIVTHPTLAKILKTSDPIDSTATLRIVQKQKCENSLANFIRYAWPIIEPGQPYIHNWNVDFICAHLEAITNGVVLEDGTPYNRLLINVPPGLTKSLIVGVFFPAWEWGPRNMPHMRYVCAAHQQDLAVRDGLRMRRLIQSEWYQANWGDRVILTGDQNQKIKFENTATGFRQAVAAGSITGSRGDRVICLPYESLIFTSNGWLPIGEIVENKLDVKIAGANGETVEWQTIEAYEQNPARPIFRLSTDLGILECTEDHRVFIVNRGWVEAGQIQVGEVVQFITPSGLQELWGKFSQSANNGVLHIPMLSPASENGYADRKHEAMPSLWQASLSASSPSGEKQKRRPLLSGLYGHIKSRGKQSGMDWRCCSPYMPSLWEAFHTAAAGSKTRKVVFWHMCFLICLGSAWSTATRKKLSYMRETIQAFKSKYKNVFQEMFGGSTFQIYSGRNKWAVCTWGTYAPLSRWMDADIQRANKEPRRELLREMRGPRQWHETACSSHRLCEGKLRPDESHNSMPKLSWQDARKASGKGNMETTIVRAVERTSRIVSATYNLRVGPQHNYFANGMLVHNCDDPLSVDGAMSEAIRDSTNTWFLEAVPTRLNNPKTSAIIVIMQRLHEEDVSGIILEKNLGYDYVMLPMRFDSSRAMPTLLGYNDPRTEDGELLFPERFPEAVVERLEESLGPYGTAGQLQQSPEPRGGGIIKRDWWIKWDEDVYPPLDFVCASLDTAYTEKTENDMSALTVWGIFSQDVVAQPTRTVSRAGTLYDYSMEHGRKYAEQHPKVILTTAWAERLELHALVTKVAKTCKDMKVDLLLIEGKASGISVAQEIQRLYNRENWGVQLINPGAMDKIARLYSVQHLFSEGMIYAPDRSWADMVITQCAQFPKAKFDDLVDSCSQALSHLRKTGMLVRSAEHLENINEAMRHKPTPPPIYDV